MPAAELAFKREEASRRSPAEGAMGGLIAGLLFAAAQMVVATALGGSPWAPWRLFASVLMGQQALAGAMTLGVFVVGFFVHFGLSALFGAFWGAFVGGLPPSIRDSWGGHAAIAMVFGLLLYFLNFQVLARFLFPWFLATDRVAQVLLHAIALGAPLGAWMTARLRPLDRPAELERGSQRA
jgi:hypothetical protein